MPLQLVEESEGFLLREIGFERTHALVVVRAYGTELRVESGQAHVEILRPLIMIQGKEISSFGSREKAVLRNKFFGFVTQDFALIPHYTVERNVRLPLDYTHMSGKEKKSRVEKILRELHIGDKKKAYPSQLSGGQKQRVAIARALVNDAKVLLCDEPTGALDSFTSSEIMGIFKELNRSGKTVIVVTHDAKVAESCKRLVCIEDGRIKSDSLR